MKLYIYEDYDSRYPKLKGSDLSDRLMMDALGDYGIKNITILRTDKGRPYIRDCSDIYISASHSGNIFVCLIGDVPLGVDVQEERRVKSKEIALRFFSEKERTYVENEGSDGFFRLWTRKEAYSKLTGLGLEEIMKKTPVLERENVIFSDFRLDNGMYCSCCMLKEENRQKYDIQIFDRK